MQPVEITKYINMALRRRYWVILPFLVVVLGGLGYILYTPKMYEAKTVILVEPQKVPQGLVSPIVSGGIEDRLRIISQQVTSRTNLESIIKEHSLIDDKPEMVMEEKLALVRKRLRLNVSRSGSGPNSFEIAYRDPSPRKAMEVTNALATNFINENLKTRESQAMGTSDFLAGELESVRRRLVAKEEELKKYREAYMGAMPDNLDTNLRILDRLQKEMEEVNTAIRDAENRKLIIQQQIAQSRMMQKQISDSMQGGSIIEFDETAEMGMGESEELAALKKQLRILETKYTENHPDVRRVREMIAKLEAEKPESEDTGKETASLPEETKPPVPMEIDLFGPQVEQINMEMRKLRVKLDGVQEKIEIYKKRVEETPQREQELISLNRDYKNIMSLYDSLLNRKLEAEIAVNMERKQKGEQFRVLDPAKIPERPVHPDVRKILLLTLALGLGLGGGLALLVETLDTSYRDPEDLEKELKLPILVSMPIRYTQRELDIQKRKRILAVSSIAFVFVVSSISLVLAAKGIDRTLNFIKNLF